MGHRAQKLKCNKYGNHKCCHLSVIFLRPRRSLIFTFGYFVIRFVYFEQGLLLFSFSSVDPGDVLFPQGKSVQRHPVLLFLRCQRGNMILFFTSFLLFHMLNCKPSPLDQRVWTPTTDEDRCEVQVCEDDAVVETAVATNAVATTAVETAFKTIPFTVLPSEPWPTLKPPMVSESFE